MTGVIRFEVRIGLEVANARRSSDEVQGLVRDFALEVTSRCYLLFSHSSSLITPPLICIAFSGTERRVPCVRRAQDDCSDSLRVENWLGSCECKTIF